MKKIALFLFALLMSTSFVKAQQQPSVERSISGVEFGGITLFGYHEMRLSNSFSLRVEAGLAADLWYHRSFFYESSGFILYPALQIQPRFYYNLNRRSERGRNISNNAADFLTINTVVIPGWLIASSEENVSQIGSISFVPTWGMRRNIGRSFEYELGAGIGYGFGFDGSSGWVFRPHLRIGYRF